MQEGSMVYRRCIIYIVRRTQLYLDDDLWTRLHLLAREQGTSVSELVRQAAREKYLAAREARRDAMLGVIGLWSDRKDIVDSTSYVRNLRKGDRLRRLNQ
jgi:hypothetical protein